MDDTVIFCVVAPLLQRYVNGDVPPIAVTVNVCVLGAHTVAPDGVSEQPTLGGGWVRVALNDFVHPFASVMVTVYVPAGNPERSSVVAPLFQRYV